MAPIVLIYNEALRPLEILPSTEHMWITFGWDIISWSDGKCHAKEIEAFQVKCYTRCSSKYIGSKRYGQKKWGKLKLE
jgi:hypothetical protein